MSTVPVRWAAQKADAQW